MSIDPGMFTDGTGDGMAGAMDVSLNTQKMLAETYYNGSKPCIECGLKMDPPSTLMTETCPRCSRKKAAKIFKNRMVG
jgi:hypothetical protein